MKNNSIERLDQIARTENATVDMQIEISSSDIQRIHEWQTGSNARRLALIEKKYSGGLTPTQLDELERLQAEADEILVLAEQDGADKAGQILQPRIL